MPPSKKLSFSTMLVMNQQVADMHHHASAGRYFEVQCLIDKGIYPDGNNPYGCTPLMVAARASQLKVVEVLINAGADIHCCDEDDWTPLHHASYAGSVEIIQCLVNKGAVLDVMNTDGQTPLMVAAYRSNKAVVELFINSGADIHFCGYDKRTVLHWASCAGSVEVVQALLNKRVDLDAKNIDGQTPLMLAANWSHTEVAELLINSGADILCSDSLKWTVLHYASYEGSVAIVQCLVNEGAALDVKNSGDQTPLMLAAAHKDVFELLINSGADIHCCSDNRWTMLHYASTGGFVNIAQYLVNKGFTLDMKNSNGETPLHMAAKSAKIEMIEYLLKAGADCNLEDNEGESPFNIIIRKKMGVEIITLCIEKGAYVKCSDYNILLEDPSLKNVILQNIELCSQAVINKFNNKDLPLFYEGHASSQKLPHIDRMKIGSRSGMALEIERAVSQEIQDKGFCNLFEMVPIVLSILCVKTSTEKSIPDFNQASCWNH